MEQTKAYLDTIFTEFGTKFSTNCMKCREKVYSCDTCNNDIFINDIIACNSDEYPQEEDRIHLCLDCENKQN